MADRWLVVFGSGGDAILVGVSQLARSLVGWQMLTAVVPQELANTVKKMQDFCEGLCVSNSGH